MNLDALMRVIIAVEATVFYARNRQYDEQPTTHRGKDALDGHGQPSATRPACDGCT